jgi:tetratricopeptide (TPR) repeat protein
MHRSYSFARRFLVASLLLSAAVSRADDHEQAAALPAPEVHRGDGWAIAGPPGWKAAKVTPRGHALLLGADGVASSPGFDGVLAPLQAGLMVRIDAKLIETSGKKSEAKTFAALKELAERDLASLRALKEAAFPEEPRIAEFKLADGSPAVALYVTRERFDRRRHTVYITVFCDDPTGRTFVVTGFYNCSLSGCAFVKATGLDDFLAAHVKSLVQDPKQLSLEPLKSVYANANWKLVEAIAKCHEGNELLRGEKLVEAIAAFRESLALCEHLSAAHAGLAWSLANKPEATAEEKTEGQRHAEIAVEQTAGRDPHSLDTLAQTQFALGNRDEAITTIKKAIELRPKSAHYQRHLQVFEGALKEGTE